MIDVCERYRSHIDATVSHRKPALACCDDQKQNGKVQSDRPCGPSSLSDDTGEFIVDFTRDLSDPVRFPSHNQEVASIDLAICQR